MSEDQKQLELEAKLSAALSEKLGRKVVFADTFKVIKVGTETDVILEPADKTLPAVAMDLIYLITSYGEVLGMKAEKEDKRDTYVR